MEEEDEHFLYVPMWFFGFLFLILSLIGCTNTAHSPMKYNDFVFHSCPEEGHGRCPICCDNIPQDEEVVVLD